MNNNKIISCGSIIIHDNKMLICRPNWNSEIWNLPKGRMEEGETYIAAAIRETFEETNIDITILQKRIKELGVFPYLKKKNLYLCLIEIDMIPEVIKCNSFYEINGHQKPEMVDYKWINFEEYSKYFSENLIRVFDSIKHNIHNFIQGENNDS